MLKKLQALGKQIVDFHRDFYTQTKAIEELLRRSTRVEQHADAAYFMREINTHLEDCGKIARKLRELSESIGCLIYAQSNNGEPIRTDYCTATPSVKMAASLPNHKDPEAFAEIMKFLGVPKELWDCEEPVVNIRWKGMIQKLSDEISKGKPLPGGVDPNKQFPQYSFVMRRKCSIEEEPRQTQNEENPF